MRRIVTLSFSAPSHQRGAPSTSRWRSPACGSCARPFSDDASPSLLPVALSSHICDGCAIRCACCSPNCENDRLMNCGGSKSSTGCGSNSRCDGATYVRLRPSVLKTTGVNANVLKSTACAGCAGKLTGCWMFACDCVSMKFYLPFRLILPDVGCAPLSCASLENEIVSVHLGLCTFAVL